MPRGKRNAERAELAEAAAPEEGLAVVAKAIKEFGTTKNIDMDCGHHKESLFDVLVRIADALDNRYSDTDVSLGFDHDTDDSIVIHHASLKWTVATFLRLLSRKRERKATSIFMRGASLDGSKDIELADETRTFRSYGVTPQDDLYTK